MNEFFRTGMKIVTAKTVTNDKSREKSFAQELYKNISISNG